MALNVNRRVKLFSSEAEYLAFLESERQKADAGTLELYETTVCCITHGDTAAPDEYLPSHDAGDEDKIFHYNEDDDIRYIPFVNPMWTMHGVSVYPTSAGYKPRILSGSHALSDVIDGSQFTDLDDEFFKFITAFPSFNVTNVENVYIGGRYSGVMFSLPSRWPSLVNYYQDKYSHNIVFEDNVLHAPYLDVFDITSRSSYPGPYSGGEYFDWNEIPSIPDSAPSTYSVKLKASDSVDLSDKFTDTSNLTKLDLFEYSTFGHAPGAANLTIDYDGEGLNMRNLTLVCSGSEHRDVHFNLTNPNGDVTVTNITLTCDFHISTFPVLAVTNANSTLMLVDCESTAEFEEAGPFGLTHSREVLTATIGDVGSVYVMRGPWLQANVVFPAVRKISGVNQLTFSVTPEHNNMESTVTLEGVPTYMQIPCGSNSTPSLKRLTIVAPSGTYSYIRNFSITGNVADLVIVGTLYVSSYIVTSGIKSITAKQDIYVMSQSGEKFPNLHVFDFFVVHGQDIYVNFTESLQSVELVYDSPFSSSVDIRSEVIVSSDITALSVSLANGKTIVYHSFILRLDSSVSLSTVEMFLSEFEKVAELGGDGSDSYADIYIYRAHYSALPQHYLDIVNKFDRIYVVE